MYTWSAVTLSVPCGELPLQGLLGLVVADEQAECARQLIDAYNDAQPLVGDEPENVPGTLIC